MQVIKKIGFITGNAMIVGSLLFAAFYVPKQLLIWKDKQTLEQINRQTLEMDTYELEYHNFAEKLFAISGAMKEQIPTQLILMPDDRKVSDEELTEYVMQEVDVLLEKMWEEDIILLPADLKTRELYMMFGNSQEESNNALAGIYLYRLVYVTKWLGYDNVEFEFFIDEQFHKLYRFSVNTFSSNTAPESTEKLVEMMKMARKKGLENILPMNMLLEYWELENSYQVDGVQENAFNWQEENMVWGIGSEDTVFLTERDGLVGPAFGLPVWRYLMYNEFALFHMQMGVWLETDAAYGELYEYDAESKSW